MSQHHPLTTLLASQPFVLLDGAMATELEAYGCDLADPLWSAKAQLHPGNPRWRCANRGYGWCGW